jgi:hypothetical protein
MNLVSIRLGETDIALPAPLDEPWRLLARRTLRRLERGRRMSIEEAAGHTLSGGTAG